tara:strand:+ start:400 stop:582 length:183 start_codon:yes stop_codon:yes gene_type:complete
MTDLIVRDFDGNEIKRVELHRTDARYVEKVMSGMLINMSDRFYIDDSEVDREDAEEDEQV